MACGAPCPSSWGTSHPVQLWAFTWEQTPTRPRGRYRPCSCFRTAGGRANSAVPHHVWREAAEATQWGQQQPHRAQCSEDTGKARAALQSPSTLLASQNAHLLTLMLDMFLGACPCSTENRERDGPLLLPRSAVCWGAHPGVSLTINGGQDDT